MLYNVILIVRFYFWLIGKRSIWCIQSDLPCLVCGNELDRVGGYGGGGQIGMLLVSLNGTMDTTVRAYRKGQEQEGLICNLYASSALNTVFNVFLLFI